MGHMLFLPQEVVRCEVWIGVFKNVQLQTTISTKKDEVNYSPKCAGAIYFSTAIYGSELKSSNRARTFIIPN